MTDTPGTEQIERNLARTRERMDHRLDALQDRLSPGQILNDAFAYFRGGDGAEFTESLMTKVKANPIPAVVTGVGLAWLMASSNRPTASLGSAPRPDLATRLRTAEEGVVRHQDEHPDAHASRLDEARGRVLGIARDASETSSGYAQRIKDAMTSAAQSMRETTHDVTAHASDVASNLGSRVQQGGSALSDRLGGVAGSARSTAGSATGNPFVLGALAAVAGLVAGALIPTSDEEERALGATADRLRSAGRDLAQDVVDRGGRVASEALAAVQGSAQEHGLTADKPVGEMFADLKSGSLLDTARQVASETAAAGKESAGKHFGGQDSGGAGARPSDERQP